MIRALIRRLALAALDCGPSTLRHALEGDARARRVLASQGVTPYDLTAIADARAARRRAGFQPRPQPGDDPLTMDPDPVPVFGPWHDVVGPDELPDECRPQIGEPAPGTPAAIYVSIFEVFSLKATIAAAARAAHDDADRWARGQGYVLLDAEPGVLRGTITIPRMDGEVLCLSLIGDRPDMNMVARLHPFAGWDILLHGERLAHGPQTGAEGERLLRAALTVLGVEVLDG